MPRENGDWRERARRAARPNGNASRNGHSVPGSRLPLAGTVRPGVQEAEPDLSPIPWPGPPAAEAFHGLAGEVVRAIDPHTEADRTAILAQFLVFFGSAAGRHAYRCVGTRRHYPNLFAVLVGRTAKGRKGTALAWVEALFGEADPCWAEDCVQTGLSSGEGLINAVRDEVRSRRQGEEDVVLQPGITDKRLLVVEEEFASVLRLAARDGNILSAVLRQAWDGGRLRTMTKNNPVKATDAHVSVVGHVTRDELVRCLGQTEQSNGFANRFLWLCVRRSKLLPDGGGQPDLSYVHRRLASALEFASHDGQLSRAAQTAEQWRRVYPALSAEVPGLLGLMTNRAEAQVLRLSAVYALLDLSPSIEPEHLRAALALWDYSVRSCRWVFGDSVGDEDADTLLAAIRARGADGMTGRDVSAVFSRNKSASEIKRLLGRLIEFGLVEMIPCDGLSAGRPAQVWRATGYEQNEQNEQSRSARTYGEDDT